MVNFICQMVRNAMQRNKEVLGWSGGFAILYSVCREGLP